jgi:hypothetical protein
MIVYSVCYYFTQNKVNNIIDHINVFNIIKDDKQFILTVMIDSTDKQIHNNVIAELTTIIQTNLKSNNFIILTSYNWGMSVLGLWLTYSYCKEVYDNNTCLYIAHFEEDFRSTCQNNEWLLDSINLLHDNKYIYIGESTSGILKEQNDFFEINKLDVNLGNPAVWTDGGYYFSTLTNLKKIESKIGIFHKGDPESKANHYLDGIIIGEVGFPTLLYNAGFTFGCLHRKNYFIHI